MSATLPPVASRMAEIEPFHAMEVMKRASALEAAGRSVIHMEVGEPDFPTAEPIVAAAMDFLRQGHVHYTGAFGLPRLREAIAAWYRSRYGVGVEPERIVVTTGGSAALLLALAVLVERDDEWLIPDPGYPCNRHFVRLLEGRPVALPVGAQTRFQPTAAQVSAAWAGHTRGLMVASPSNPTGTLLPEAELAAISRAVAARGGQLIVDEIYHGLTYEGAVGTVLRHTESAFVVNSFSKYFGMTGWRVGWLVVPPAYVRQVEKAAQNFYICPPVPAQHAALAAFAPQTLAILEARREEFRQRRDLLLSGLADIGIPVRAKPEGAFYVYADVGGFGNDSFALALDLLERAGVAITPGLDFGRNQPERFVRMSYTTSLDNIGEGLERMRRHFGRR